MRDYYAESDAYRGMLEAQDPAIFEQYVDLYARFAAGGERVLDVGCGTGTSTLLLRERGYDAVGVDFSARFLPTELGEFIAVDFQDAREIESDSFAAAGAFNVLEHVERPERFLAEIVRVVRPGGHVILLSPNLSSPLAAIRVLTDHVLGRTPYLGVVRGRDALRLLAANVGRTLAGTLGRDRFATRAAPLDSGVVGFDQDAVYWTNASEVRRRLVSLGCEIALFGGYGRTGPARLVSRLAPPAAGTLSVVAVKRR